MTSGCHSGQGRSRGCAISPILVIIVSNSFKTLWGGAHPFAQGMGSQQSPRPGVHPHLIWPGQADEPGGAAAGEKIKINE